MEENAIGMPDSFFERLNKKNGFADDTTAAPVDSGTTPVATDKTIPSGMPDSFFEKLNSQQHYADTNNWAENYKRYIPQAEENPSAWDNIKNNFFAIKDASEASMYGGLELMSRQGEKSGNANFANFIKAAGMYYGADPNWLVKNMQENEAQSQEELKRVWLDPKMGQFNATDMFADPKSFFQTQLPQMLGGSATLMAAGMGIAKGVQTGVMALGAAGAPFTFGGSAVAAGFIGSAVASAISRPIESLMEGYGAFDEAYSELAKKYPNATHQQLTDMAMPVFNKTFDENMQLQVLDAVQIGLSIIPVTAWGKGALSGTGAIGRMARRADMMRQRYNVAAHIGETAFQMGTEGWEEGRQMQITNEAINKYVGTDKPTSWYDMLNTKEGQSAVSGGAFMGGMMESPGILKLAYNKLTGVGDDIKTKPYEDIKQKQTALFYGNIAKSVNEGTTNEMMQAINKFGRSGVLATVETDDADSRNKSSIAEAKRLGDEVAEQVGVFSRMKEQYPDVSEKGLVRMFQNNALIRNNANALKTLSEDNVTDAPIIQRINAQNEALNKENNDIIAGKDVWETPSHEDPFADPEKDKEADIPFDSVEEVEAARLKEIEALQQIPTDGMTDEQMHQRTESLAEINSRYEDLKNRLTEKINDAKGHYENQRVLTEMLQNNIPVEGTIQKAYGMHYDFVTQDGKTVRFYNQATHDVVDDNDFNGSAFLVLRKAEQGLDGTYKDEKGNYLFRSVLGDKDHAERIEVHTTDKDGNDKYLGNVAVSNTEDYNIARDRAKAARMEKLEGEDGEGEGFSVSDEQLSGVKTTSNEQAAEAQSYGFRNAYHALNSVNKYFDADYTDYANIPKEDLALVGRIKQEEAASATTTTPPPDSPPPSEPDTPPAPPTPPPTPPPAPQSPSPATAPSGTTSSTDSGNAGYERTERSFDKVNVGDNITHNGKQGKVFAKVRPKGSLSHPVVLAKDAEGKVFRVSESEYKGTERGESDNVLKTNGKLVSYRNDIGRIVVDEENNVIFEGNKSSVELGKTTDEEFAAKSIGDIGISYVNENSLNQAILVDNTVYVKGEQQELVRINYDKNGNVVSYTYKNSKGQERTNRNYEAALDVAIQKNNQEFDKSRKGASDEVKQRDEEHISGVVKAEYGDSIGYILETMPDEVYDTFDLMESGVTSLEKDAIQYMVLRTIEALADARKRIEGSNATKKEKGSALSMIEKFEKDLNKYYGKLDQQGKVSAKDVAKANTGENNKGVNTVQDAEQKTEAYHADKAAGKETESVKAVEDLINKNESNRNTTTEVNPKAGVSSNSNEGNTALRDVESTAKALDAKKADIERRMQELEKKYEETKERHLRELEKAGVDLGKRGIAFNDIIHNIEEENNSNNYSEEVETLAKKQYEEWWALNREKIEIESDANKLSFSDYNFSGKQSILDRLKKALSKVYQTNRQALDEGFIEWAHVEREVASVGGDQYSAHGMGKTTIASAFTDLINLFEKGISPFRGQGALDVATLAGGISDGTTAGGAYMYGAFTLVANRNHNGRIKNINQIGGIIVNEGIATPEVLSALKELFPNLVIESTLNSKSLVEQLNAKYDAELKAVEELLTAKQESKPSTVSGKEEGSGVGGDVDFTAKGGNRIVDEKGNPVVLLHGTNNDKVRFDEGTVFYATDDKQFADVYGENHLPVIISLKNPYDLTDSVDGIIKDANGEPMLDKEGKPYSINYVDESVVKDLKSRGFDGIRMGNESVVAFDRNQVKEQFLPTKEVKAEQPTVSETPPALRDVESTAKPVLEDEYGNDVYWHGSDKQIEGQPKVGRSDSVIKTKMGGIPFKDLWDAFYVTVDKGWAEFFSPKRKQVHGVQLKKNAKVLDLSEVAAESTHLKNKAFLGGQNIKNDFPFQKDFDAYAFDWLNKEREKNGKPKLTKEEFKNKDLENSFRPTHKNWFLDDLGSQAFADYAKEKGYDAVKFGREVAILNPDVAKFVANEKSESLLSKEQTPPALRDVESTAKDRVAKPISKRVAVEHAGYEGAKRVTGANENTLEIDGYGTVLTSQFINTLVDNGRLPKEALKNRHIQLTEEYATKLLNENADLFPKEEKAESKTASKISEDKDTLLVDGIQNVSKNKQASDLLRIAMNRGVIPENLYNDFGKELAAIKVTAKSKDAIQKVAEVISKYVDSKNEKTEKFIKEQNQAVENADFEKRAYADMTPQEKFEAVIEDKAATSEKLTPKELEFVNENYFIPKGYRYNENFELVKSESLLSKEQTPTALSDVESTAKALERVGNKNLERSETDETPTAKDVDYGDITWQQYGISSFNKGSDGKTYITDKNGDIYEISKTKVSANNTFLVVIKNKKGDDIGNFEFKKNKDGSFSAEEAFVSERRKGLASIAYDFASKDGIIIKPSNRLKSDGIKFWSKSISEAYHKAKADGSNPELVKAVEELLDKPKETSPTPNSKGEGTEVKYQIEESRDEPLASVNPALAEYIRQRMQRLFPSVALFSDKASFEAAAKKVSKGVTFSSAYIGAAIKNMVYVDAEKALQHTEIHEYAHIYWDALPADHPLKVSLLEKFGGNEEAAIDAIGRAGTIIMENELDIAKSGFFEKWLKKFWAAVKGVFTSKSIEQAFAERLLTNADEVTEENITSGVVKYMKMKSSAKYSELSEKAVKGIEKIIGKKISSLTFPEYYKHISTEIKPNDFKQWKMLSPQKFLEKMYGIVSPVSTLSPSNKAVFMKQYREYLDDYNWAENNVWTRFASGSMTLTVKEIEDLYMEAYKRKSYGTKDAVNFLADLYSKAVMYKNMQQEIKGDTFNKPFAKMSFDMMSGHEITDLSGSEFVSGKYSLLSPDRVKETILQGREKLYREVQRNATIKEDALKNDFDAIWKRVKDLKSDLRKIVDKTGTYFIDRNSSAYKALRGGTAADRALADLLDMHYKYESAYGGLSMEKGKYRVPVARMDFGGLAKKFGFKEGMRRYFAKPSKYDNVIIDVRSLGLSKPLMTLKQARQEMVKGSNAIYPFQMLKLTKKVDALTKEAYKQFNSGRHANGDIVTTEDLSGSRYGVSFVKDDESSEDLKVSMMLYHYANIENESYDLLSPYSMYIQKYLGRKDKPNMLKWVKMLDDDLIKGESPTSNLGVYAKYVQALTNYTHWLQLGFNIAGMPFNAFAGFAQSVREIGFRNTLKGLRRVIGSLTVGGGAGVVNAKAISIMEKLHIVSLSKDLEMSVTSKIGKGISKIAFLPVSFVEYINHAYSFIGAMDESEWERVKALPANASAEDYTKAMGGNERVDELHTLTQKINGAYSKYSRRGINKTAEGRALMQFKNWLPDVIFAHLTVSQLNEAGEDLYGEYQSGIATSIKNTVWNKTIIPMFKDKSIAQAKKNWETLSEHERMQVGKAMRQLVILGGMALWIASLDDRDDKELKRMLKRAMGDVTYIFDVSNMQFLFDNTVPVFGTIKNLLGLVAEVFSTATGNPSVYEKRQGSHMRGDLKLPVMIENQTPVVNKISKLVNEGD